jgi:hypothetical protein
MTQEAPQPEQPAGIHAQQQQQRRPAMQLMLPEVPTALPQAEQLAPEPPLQQPSLFDLLMDAMQQPAAAAAGLTGEMSARFLGLLPVQAEKVGRCFFCHCKWIARLPPSHSVAEVLCRSAAWWS